jgi:hypothetical protein
MSLQEIESLLTQRIKSTNSPPFFGLASLDDDNRKRVFVWTHYVLRGDANRISELFRKAPIVAAWSVTQALSTGYGESDLAIYRHIEEALGIQLDNQSRRRALHDAFCKVCEQMGLPVRGFDRMVDVYLVHAGVPVAHLPHLIDAFLHQEAAFGPPPVEATLLLNRWEDDALEFLPASVITPRRTILWDETAWHAALYARIREAPEAFQPANLFEDQFAGILRDRLNGSVPIQRRTAGVLVARPRLVWQGGGLRLRLPRTEGRMLVVPDGAERPLRMRGGDDWVLPQPWPRKIHWQVEGETGEINLLSMLGGFAVFDLNTGQLVRELADPPHDIEVDASEVVIVARETFTIGGEPALDCGTDGFVLFAQLGPVALRLDFSERRFELRARPRRRLSLRGGQIAGGPKGFLYSNTATLRVETGLGQAEVRGVLVTIAGQQMTAEIPIDSEGIGELDVGELLKLYVELEDADPLRLRVDLLAPTEATTPAHVSGVSLTAWLWPGFRSNDGLAFTSVFAPSNLVLEQSRSVVRESHGMLCLDPAGGYVQARAVFEIDERFVPFDLAWPDVTVVRRRGDGLEQGLPLGVRLSVGDEDRFDTITIRCPDADAALVVRGRREQRPFAEGLTRSLALRELITPASNDRVVLHRGNGHELLLFELVPALAPSKFELRPADGALRLRLVLSVEIDAIALELEDEQGGSQFVEAALRYRPVDSRKPDWLSAHLRDDDPLVIELAIDLSSFISGMTLARLLVRPDGHETWRPLRNARGDTYALALAQFGQELRPSHDDLQPRFERMCRWLADCYATECWSHLDHVLTPIWRSLGIALHSTVGGPGAVMSAAALPPPDHASPSWVPISHPLMILPDLYGATPDAFASLSASTDLGVAELSALFTLGTARLRELSHLHPTVFLAFRNRIEATQTGAPLAGFEPELFFSNLPLIDSDPAAGWFWRGTPLLGPDHWRAAHLRFIERIEGVGLFIANEVEEGTNSLRQESLQRLIHAAWVVTPTDLRPPAPTRTIDAIEAEPIDEWVAGALSSFSQASRMGTVHDYVASLALQLEWSDKAVLTTISFLLRLAPELFAYYLLLWEIAKERP